MTAVTARAAGVPRVVVATPNPGPLMVAAAAIAGADAVLAAGGHPASRPREGLDGAFGPSDVIVGPGNRWVTAAKQPMAAGSVGIDLPAGPSSSASSPTTRPTPTSWPRTSSPAGARPRRQPTLVARSAAFVDRVDERLRARLTELATRDVAARALAHGVAVVAASEREALAAVSPPNTCSSGGRPCPREGPARHFGRVPRRGSAEVFGDYGVGPNHVLPTGARRFSGGLSACLPARAHLAAARRAGGGHRRLRGPRRVEQLDGHRRAALARRS